MTLQTQGRLAHDVDLKDASKRIRARRLHLSLSKREVAEQINTSISTYTQLEHNFPIQAVVKHGSALATALQYNLQWLIYGIGVPPAGLEDWSSVGSVDTDSKHRTQAEREALGARAKARRLEIGANRPEIAQEIGVTHEDLRNYETCLTANIRVHIEARWESALCVPRGWLRNPELATPAGKARGGPVVPQAETVAGEIRCVANWLSRSSYSTRSTLSADLTDAERRRAAIFATRYGVDGEEQIVLHQIGESYQLTRERIRQIVEQMLKRKDRLSLQTPKIDALQIELANLLPAPIEYLNRQLAPLLGGRLSIESADRFCRELLDRPLLTVADSHKVGPAAWATAGFEPGEDSRKDASVIRAEALSMIRSCGAAQIFAVTGAASAKLDRGLRPSEVIRACQMIADFDWLSEQDGWFWFGSEAENRFLNACRKILTVADSQVDVEVLVGGAMRARRSYADSEKRPLLFEIPISIAVALLRKVPGIRNIQSDDFVLVTPDLAREVLSKVEMRAFEVMIENGNVAARHTVATTIVKEGVATSVAAHLCLGSSPIFYRLERGVFALRGRSAQLDGIQVAQSAVGGSSKGYVPVSPPDAHDYVHVQRQFTEYMLRTHVWAVPAGLAKRMTPGPYTLEGSEAPLVLSNAWCGSHRLNRIVTGLKHLGFQVGDYFDLALHPAKRHIVISRIPAPPHSELSEDDAVEGELPNVSAAEA